MNKWVLEKFKPEKIAGGNMFKTEAVLLLAPHANVWIFGNENNVGENRRQQEKRNTKYDIN